MDRAVAWYCDKLGFSSQSKDPDEVYIGYPSGRSGMNPMFVLVPILPGQTNVYTDRHQILFTKKVDSLHAEFAALGIRRKSILQMARLGRQYHRSVSGTRGAPKSGFRIG
jgi:hypothetical protein